MTAGLPSPKWPLVDEDGRPTQPWYSYLKSADEAWRVKVVNLTSLSTVSDITADLLPNSGVSVMQSVPATTRTLADPVPGCRKTLCVTSTSTTGMVTLQTTALSFRSTAGTTGWKLAFTSSDAYKVAELIGISTSEYLIVNTRGTITVTTT